ncbi:hypothetical protein MYX04_12290 [Nitrospiraceae bacterium AH_259_D15_M11_P09]|nr:hypothetical protein [Nitrospiraceae bacterium AH_259_D15_M11_P09]
MDIGTKRTAIARLAATLGFVCGVIGLLAGLTDHAWKLGSIGWFTGGALLALLGVYVLVDGAVSFQKARVSLREVA